MKTIEIKNVTLNLNDEELANLKKQLEAKRKKIVNRLKEIRSCRRRELALRKKLGLWSRQELELYHYLEHYFGVNGFTPTTKEMKENLGIKSTRGLTLRLDKLEIRGVITREYGKRRGIRLVSGLQYTAS